MWGYGIIGAAGICRCKKVHLFFDLPIDLRKNSCIIVFILIKENIMEKATKVKKVEITKEAMVRLVEQNLDSKNSELASLEEQTTATIALFLR